MANMLYNGGNRGAYIGSRPDSTPTALINPIQLAGGYRYQLVDSSTGDVLALIEFSGNLTIDAQGALATGTVTKIKVTYAGDDNSFKEIVVFSVNTTAAIAYNQGYAGILSGSEMLTGSKFNDTLFSFAGNDVVNGMAGNDNLNGGLGNDTLNGGSGNDALSYFERTTDVTIVLGSTGSGTVTIGTEIDTYFSIEWLEGGYGNDNLTGNNFENGFYGSEGNDTIAGLGGDDFLYGGDGNDKLLGGVGDDWLFGELGNDLIDGGTGSSDGASYYYATAGVVVDLVLQGTAQNTVGDGIDTLFNIDKLEGSSHNDRLYGDAFNNTLIGLGGNDTLVGRGGDDFLIGGAGRDGLSGGAGSDWASYEMATFSTIVDLSKQNVFQDTLGDGIDKLISIENLFGSEFDDIHYGNAGGNILEGWWGNDILDGRAGSDIIIGRQEDDELTGGADRDTFVFYSGEAGNDTIMDLDIAGTDKDVIEFYGVFTDFNDFMAAGIQTSAGFRVTLEAGSTVLFSGRTAADLAQADFGFYL